MTIPFTKPFMTVDQQLQQLVDRGMACTDTARAKAYLSRIGYYRLSAYWYPFRGLCMGPTADGAPSYRGDQFLAGTAFTHSLDLYLFDKRLRLMMLDAIERIEVALRVDVAIRLGSQDRFAHRKPAFLHGHFAKQAIRFGQNTGRTQHNVWLAKLDAIVPKSNEDFVRHFRATYSDPLPIWAAIELWDFGMLATFFAGMKHADQDAIAIKYGIRDRDVLVGWLRTINHVRNICAHHGRLWNRNLDVQPKPTVVGDIPLLDHISRPDRRSPPPAVLTRTYGAAAIIQYLIRHINPSSSWNRRVRDHITNFPAILGVTIQDAAFPVRWETLPLWQ
ncbi:Abi family protein [Niveispirillum sp. SYP-B3756]|nr:Abi family protein [Niveispirillum sp. SYP-B3756]